MNQSKLRFFNKTTPASVGILFIIILAFFVGGGILAWQWWETMKKPEPTPSSALTPAPKKKIEVTDELVKKIMNQVIPVNNIQESAKFFIDDLNNDGYPEIIITAAGKLYEFYEGGIQRKSFYGAYYGVVRLLNQKGDYEELGSVIDDKMRGEQVPSVQRVEDIDKDNEKEIFAFLAWGGASCIGEGILDVDFSKQKIDWVKVQGKDGKIGDAMFCQAASAGHHNWYDIGDLDKDGNKEIVEASAENLWKEPESIGATERVIKLGPEVWSLCRAELYEWTGSVFSYQEELSKTLLSQLNSECMR